MKPEFIESRLQHSCFFVNRRTVVQFQEFDKMRKAVKFKAQLGIERIGRNLKVKRFALLLFLFRKRMKAFTDQRIGYILVNGVHGFCFRH